MGCGLNLASKKKIRVVGVSSLSYNSSVVFLSNLKATSNINPIKFNISYQFIAKTRSTNFQQFSASGKTFENTITTRLVICWGKKRIFCIPYLSQFQNILILASKTVLFDSNYHAPHRIASKGANPE